MTKYNIKNRANVLTKFAGVTLVIDGLAAVAFGFILNALPHSGDGGLLPVLIYFGPFAVAAIFIFGAYKLFRDGGNKVIALASTLCAVAVGLLYAIKFSPLTPFAAINGLAVLALLYGRATNSGRLRKSYGKSAGILFGGIIAVCALYVVASIFGRG